jgi:hypothetical protein
MLLPPYRLPPDSDPAFCIVLPFRVWGRPYILIVDDNRNRASYPAMQGG